MVNRWKESISLHLSQDHYHDWLICSNTSRFIWLNTTKPTSPEEKATVAGLDISTHGWNSAVVGRTITFTNHFLGSTSLHLWFYTDSQHLQELPWQWYRKQETHSLCLNQSHVFMLKELYLIRGEYLLTSIWVFTVVIYIKKGSALMRLKVSFQLQTSGQWKCRVASNFATVSGEQKS